MVQFKTLLNLFFRTLVASSATTQDKVISPFPSPSIFFFLFLSHLLLSFALNNSSNTFEPLL